MSYFVTTVGKGGRVVIPSEYRARLGMEPGARVVMTIEEEGVQIRTPAQAVSRAQALVREYVADDVSLVDELIADRRAEAAREDETRSHPDATGDAGD